MRAEILDQIESRLRKEVAARRAEVCGLRRDAEVLENEANLIIRAANQKQWNTLKNILDNSEIEFLSRESPDNLLADIVQARKLLGIDGGK